MNRKKKIDDGMREVVCRKGTVTDDGSNYDGEPWWWCWN